MSYNCLIIDDEPLARELLETYLEKIPNFNLIASCENAIKASTYLSNTKIDLLFLDIEMPVLKGTDFFKNLSNKPEVIFTTAYRDYALEGFELNAVDYLLKPIFFDRFFSAIQKFIKQQPVLQTYNNNKKTAQHIFVSKAKKQIKIILQDILYVESLKDYIKINLKNDSITVKESISNFEKRIDNRFVRIHRSYIINKEEITAYTKNDIEIGNIEIPIGKMYKGVL